MSVETLKQIIGRAFAEPEYKELLFSNPDQALEGYELTEQELSIIKGVARENFDSVAVELDERISRVWGLARILPVKLPGS